MEFLKLLQGIRTEFLNVFFELITMLGEETLMVLIIVSLWFAFDKRFAQKLFYVTVMSLSVNGILKNIVREPRPFANGEIICVRPDTATGYAFPSGHTQNFTTWATFFSVRFKKLWFTLLASVLVILVGFSRLYLGAHYPRDVVFGVILGITGAIAGGFLHDKFKNKCTLYFATALVLTPFAVFFFMGHDPLFEDFFKLYGMIWGLLFAVSFEEKYAPVKYDVSAGKKVLRIITGLVVALLIKVGLSFEVAGLPVGAMHVIDSLRYMLLVFAVLGLCPLLFKKLNW